MKRTKKIVKDKDGKIRNIFTYDEKGNLIHRRYNGKEIRYEYNENGNCIYSIDTYFNIETWKEYDERGNCIHVKNSIGEEQWFEYDEKNREIHFKDISGAECFYEYEEEEV